VDEPGKEYVPLEQNSVKTREFSSTVISTEAIVAYTANPFLMVCAEIFSPESRIR
jgi:hypothetical protein